MPEGDTLRRLADTICGRFAGQTVKSSLFRHPRLSTVDLTDVKLKEADARGKHLLLRFSNHYTVHVHLRMNGSVYCRFPANINANRRKFEIEFEGGWMVAVDIPVLEMFRTKDEPQAIGYLGPDICGQYDHAAAVERLSNSGAIPVTQALLDQRLVAGFGNIYAVETPFIVGINPYTTVDKLNDVDSLLSIGVGLMRTNARFGPQNTTGKNLLATNHWVLSSRIIDCKVCGSRLRRVTGANSPWQRRHAWCDRCQPEDATVVDLNRTAKLLSLHPCRQIVDLETWTLIADVTEKVCTESLSPDEGGKKRMR